MPDESARAHAKRNSPDAPVRPPLAVGTLMLALGDSIAAGIGASHASEGCMAVLAAGLDPLCARLRLHNLAVPGETSASMLAPGGQLERAEEVLAAAARRDDIPGPVVLSIGGNDAMEAALLGDDAARARLGDNLDTIFGRLAAALRPFSLRLDEVACVQTVYNPLHALAGNGDVPHTPDSIAPRRATRGSFNPIIREAAARAGVRVAEVSRAFYGRGAELTWVLSGDIHPSDSGHRLIAAVYADTCGWPHL